MSSLNNIQKRNKRRKRIRARVSGTSLRPRLSVFRSNRHIYAQIIDDKKGITLVSASDKELLKVSNNKKVSDSQKKIIGKKDVASEIGGLLASKSAKKKIKRVVFDRGGYKYHGRIAALAEGARKGGLEF